MAVSEKSTFRSNATGLEWYLPQSVDDKTIQNAVRTLFDQIELHVDNYYHKTAVVMEGPVLTTLSLFDSGYLPAPVADMIASPQAVLPVIKYCIANLLITGITPGSYEADSLLPARLATAPVKLTAASVASNEQRGKFGPVIVQ